MQNGYNQGFTTVAELNTRLYGTQWDGNATVVPTQYCLVPIGDDLACPDPGLAALVDAWNKAPLTPNQLVAAGTVAQYIELLGFHQARSSRSISERIRRRRTGLASTACIPPSSS